MPQIAAIGAKILTMILDIGYWMIVITGTIECIRHATRGDYEGAFKSVIMTGAIVIGLQMIPTFMSMIRGSF